MKKQGVGVNIDFINIKPITIDSIREEWNDLEYKCVGDKLTCQANSIRRKLEAYLLTLPRYTVTDLSGFKVFNNGLGGII